MKKIIFYLLLLIIFDISFAAKVFSLQAGVYSGVLEIPIGFPTAGYAQSAPADEPKSPFAAKFPATRGIHTFIKVKVIYLKDNLNSLSIIRLDTVGVDINIYRKLKEKIDDTLKSEAKNHTLILSGTHTHAGPGRLARNLLWWVAADTYSQWLFESLVNQIFNAWQEAAKNITSLKIGFGSVDLDEIIVDRRCENPELKDGTARFIKLENNKGKLVAVILNFGIHGTVLGGSNHYFSVDAPGLIEMKIEEQFNYPIVAFLIQGNVGDIAPRSPVDFKNPWDNMENIGEIAKDELLPILSKTKTTATVDIKSVHINTELSREILGYKDDEFPYPYGAMLCGLGAEHCDNDFITPIEEMKNCPLFDKKFSITETQITGVKINEFLILTLPGEVTTPLAEELRKKIEKELNTNNVMIFGCSQDHLGYLLLSWDWWQGGYEPSMTPWGWKLGEFLIDKSFAIANNILKGKPLPEIISPVPKVYKEKIANPPTPGVAKDFGKVAEGIKNNNGEVRFSWFGGDPSVDTPSVSVERKINNKWQQVLQKNGIPLTVAHYSIFLNFSSIPTYKESPKAELRQFRWEVVWRHKRPVSSTLIIKPGLYRFKISGKAFYNGKIEEYQINSEEIKI